MFENVVKETKKAQKLSYKAGEYNNKIETAKQALIRGADINFISEITGLTVKKIEELKKEIEK